MLSYKSGIIGFPLRLLAREIFDKCVKKIGAENIALITGEEKIIPKYIILLDEFETFFERQDVSKKTVESYMYGLRAHTLNEWGDKLVNEITPKMKITRATSK